MMFLMTAQAEPLVAKVLHEVIEEQQVTNGVKHTQKEVLTSSGWQDVNILHIDLSEEHLEVRVLKDDTFGTKATVTELARAQGAVAAVNADFFDLGAKIANGFGPVVTEGEINYAYNTKYSSLGPKKHMATFLIDENNHTLLDYYDVRLSITGTEETLFEVTGYNNLLSTLNTPVVIDGKAYQDNQAVLDKYKQQGVYTVLIEDQTITYVSALDEFVALDEETQAVIMKPETFETHIEALQVGEALSLESTIVLNNEVIRAVEELEMSVGGGGIIMKNGEAYTGEAHKVSGDKKEPRTILATTHQEQELLLLTVDGRGKSIGANHNDLIEMLKGLDVKDAMYLDGGGSTTMTVREEGETEVTLQNKPSSVVERKVANGIGVFTTGEQGELAKIIVEAPRNRTFVGEGLGLTIKGIDEYGNPLPDFEDNIELSVSGVSGDWAGHTFYPTTQGQALIMVTSGDVTGMIEIEVTEPKALYIEPSAVQINSNSTKKVQVYGVDSEGYKIPVDPQKLSWQSSSPTITATGDTIITTEEEFATLTASYKGVEGKVDVIVGESVVRVESFEENTASWSGTSPTVEGTVEVSKDVKYHGEQALKMSYTFDKDENKQIAYTVFDTPIMIEEKSKSVNMWLNAHAQGDTVKIQVEDAKGQTHYLKAVDALNFTGWKYTSIPLPQDMALPAKVTKLYAYTDKNEEKRTSTLVIDHVSLTKGNRTPSGISERTDYTFDPMYKPSLEAATGDQYSIKVTGPTKVNGLNLNDATLGKLESNLTKNAAQTIEASQVNLALDIPNALTYKNAYEVNTYENLSTIFVGTGSGSMRTQNEDQWGLLKDTLATTESEHILLVMGHNPLTQFSDAREGEALHDYLVAYRNQTGKNIFVITTGGTSKETRIEEGIRYIRLNGLQTTTDQIHEGEYLRFKVVGDAIYYTFEPMV